MTNALVDSEYLRYYVDIQNTFADIMCTYTYYMQYFALQRHIYIPKSHTHTYPSSNWLNNRVFACSAFFHHHYAFYQLLHNANHCKYRVINCSKMWMCTKNSGKHIFLCETKRYRWVIFNCFDAVWTCCNAKLVMLDRVSINKMVDIINVRLIPGGYFLFNHYNKKLH